LCRERSARREPANYVANSTADVDDSYRSAKTFRTQRGNKRVKQLANAVAVEKFLGEALHFPVNGQQESVDGKWIEKSVTFGDRVYCLESFLILKFREDGQDVVLANGQAIEGGRVMVDDEVGNFGLLWNQAGEHKARLAKAGCRTKSDSSGL
jgi:hypothetical protein